MTSRALLRVRALLRQRERGAATAFIVVLCLLVLLVAAFVVDASQKLQADRRAQFTAQEAARAGANRLSGGIVDGQDAQVDPSGAATAARRYLADAGVTGTVTVTGTTVHVTTTASWHGRFSPIGGEVTGDALVNAETGGGP